MDFPTGCILDGEARDRVIEQMRADGKEPMFGSARPALSGHWQRLIERGVTGVFLQDAEVALFGKTGPAFSQHRGTCVGQGTGRAIQDAVYYAAANGVIMKTVQISPEFIYPLARNKVEGAFRGRHYANSGNNDGTAGSAAAEGVSRYGVLPRGSYGTIDLTKPNELLALQWADPGPGIPQVLLDAASGHKCDAFFVKSVESLADAVAAGYGGQVCLPRFVGNRDANAMSRFTTNGQHCTEICGVFLDEKGRTNFVYQQSWDDQPYGPSELRYAGGTKTLRQGSCGVYGTELAQYLAYKNSEAWAFGIRDGNEFRPETLA